MEGPVRECVDSRRGEKKASQGEVCQEKLDIPPLEGRFGRVRPPLEGAVRECVDSRRGEKKASQGEVCQENEKILTYPSWKANFQGSDPLQKHFWESVWILVGAKKKPPRERYIKNNLMYPPWKANFKGSDPLWRAL